MKNKEKVLVIGKFMENNEKQAEKITQRELLTMLYLHLFIRKRNIQVTTVPMQNVLK